jgi:hypothetical protein
MSNLKNEMMGNLKDFYDIMKDIIDESRKPKRQLGKYLLNISTSINLIINSFKNNEIPRTEAKYIIGLIQNADELTDILIDEVPEIRNEFKLRIKNIEKLMDDGDIIIKRNSEYKLHYTTDNGETLPYQTKLKMVQICDELERVSGSLKAFSEKLINIGE